MKRYLVLGKSMLQSQTAKDTFVLFGGNVGSAFWGFLFTLIVARSVTVSEFGVFSAVLNLVVIISSLSDLGITSGLMNFVAESLAKGDKKTVNEYIKAAFIIRLLGLLVISVIILAFCSFISVKLLASDNPIMGVWAVVISIFWSLDLFFPYVLQAEKKFMSSIIYDNIYYLGRLTFAFAFYFVGALTVDKSFWAFGFGFVLTLILTYIYFKTDFLKSKPTRQQYSKLIKFSGWLAVNRVVSSVSGRLDIQMLAAFLGATATGLYSIPSRLASFIIVLSGSYSSVLATRLAGFGDIEKEKNYIIKSTLALIPIALGIIIWIVYAKPFIVLLFGPKYLSSVPIFQALAAAQIPFLFTAPAVSAIIYSMKKTVYIGTLSFFQLAVIFLLNYYFIPKYGAFGPTLTFGITNTLLAIYVWYLVIKYYWFR